MQQQNLSVGTPPGVTISRWKLHWPLGVMILLVALSWLPYVMWAPPWFPAWVDLYSPIVIIVLGGAVLVLHGVTFWAVRILKKAIVARGEEIARLNRVLKERDEQIQILKKGGTSTVVPLLLSVNEIIYPPEGGVLWWWDQKSGAGGPFCPLHKSRLFYRDHYANADRIENFDKSFLSGAGWFVCPLDTREEFIFVKLGSITVGHLRERAAERLKVKLENELVSPP